MQKSSSHTKGLKEGNDSNSSSNSSSNHLHNENNAALVTKLRENDVLLGRGGGTNNHAGNVKFRKLVNEHKLRYLAASKVDKPKIAREVVHIWRSMQPPGRFLARHDEDVSEKSNSSHNGGENNHVWVEVGDKKANAKASQCLRERTPEVMPYLRQLREHQDLTTEQGVMMVRQHQQPGGVSGTSTATGAASYPVDPFAPQSYSPMAAESMSPHQTNPMGRRMSGVQTTYSPHHMMGYASPSQISPRRPGLPMAPSSFHGGTAPIPPGPPPIATADPSTVDPMDPSVAAYYGDMTDLEYEQSMMIMQQQLEMQQMQLRRMQQQRAMQRAALESSSGHNMTATVTPPSTATTTTRETLEDVNARKPKRSLSMTKPERTNSGLSALNPIATEADGELTLEEYRQQLEAYMSSAHHDDDDNGDDDDDDGHASDLEDDWEKERDKHMNSSFARRTPNRGVSRTRSRGVDRAKSGASFMSIGTRLSGTGMSVVSGFSNLSDLMSAAEEYNKDHNDDDHQRKVDRTMSNQSNLSIMSELTDLSANIDNLSLYED
jgi:hypothetical protein